MEPRSSAKFTPEEALARIAGVAGVQSSLRSRFEGMTWVLWGLVATLEALTLGFVYEAEIAETGPARHIAAFASHLWIVVGIVASVGIWRAAAVNFDPGISRRRALTFFIGWPAAFAFASYVATELGSGPVGIAGITALLLLAFAFLNPVRFTPRGRWTAAVLALVAALVTLAVWAFGSPAYAWHGIAGPAIGLSWVLAGLYALYQG